VSRPRIPQYRRYKPKNLGLVVIRGKAHYLGRYNSPESWEKYHRLIADLLHSPPISPTPPGPPDPAGSGPTINELVLDFWTRFVSTYYVKNGRPTSEQDNIRQALRFLRSLHGSTPAVAFGPRDLVRVRRAMVDAGRCRTLINKDVNRVRGLFRWAVEEELYPGHAYQALRAVKGLARGRGDAPDHPPVVAVAEEVVRATLPHLSPQVAALVRLQLLTGARPGEIAAIRPCDVDRSDPAAWIYRPDSHKTEHLGRERVIVLGPRAQEVLGPWLDREPTRYCFSPAEVVAARRNDHERGASFRSGGGGKGSSRVGSQRRPGDRYNKDALRVAIQRACRRAGVGAWTPHQLRHTRATEIRRAYGIEAARTILGHSRLETTEIYAEQDRARAREIMAAIG
jgi:integrase